MKILELEDTKTKIKSYWIGPTERTEERISELQDRIIKITHSE